MHLEGEPPSDVTVIVAIMAVHRMDHVSIVVTDLDAAARFFTELGLEREGEATVEGDWVDGVNGLDGVRVEIVMMAVPSPGTGRLELTRFLHPPLVDDQPEPAPPNTLGLRSIMFAVDDVDGTVARLAGHGGTLLGSVEQYENAYRLCYVRGPGGIIVSLAQALTP
ncbi:VOC family protein [Gordonia caeni]|uniref:VOC family protein n=2 Tax=Gordonia caeni TaxID=1007097 RepID=A0ABP7PLE6_9ACTN